MSRIPRRLPALRKPWLLSLTLAILLHPAGGGARPAPPAAGAEPWDAQPFAADPAEVARAAAKVEGKGGDDVVVLLSEASYGFDDAGRETYVQRLVYRILTPGADESWSTVEEDWEPWHQARPEVRARVITPDGVEHDLDPATITENGAAAGEPDMFEDGRVLRAPLPATRPGAVVELQLVVRDTATFFDGGVVRFHGFDPGVPLRHARLTLEAPAATPLRWVARKLPGGPPTESVAGGRRRVAFEARDLEPADDPGSGLPPEVPRTAYVAFSTGRSWADLARRYGEIVDTAIRGSDLAAFLRSAGGPAPSQLDTVNLFLARLGDEVRYTGMELGEGGLVPRRPVETLRRKFGDCKDKAVLLTAMLRAADIPAYVALLNAAEDEEDVEESLPGFGLFNHAIVVVPGSPPLWVDPTDRYARAGELPAADQGRLALIASPTATGLTRTPESTAAENREVETREFFLADLGPSRVVESAELSGQLERDLRSYYAREDAQTVRQGLKSYAANSYLAEDVGTVEHSKATDLTTPMHLRVEIKNARRGFTDTRNAAVGLSPAALLTRLPYELTESVKDAEEDAEETAAAPAPRLDDYVFTRPMTLEVRYRIVPPPGFAPQPLPGSRTRRLGTLTLSEEYAAGADGVVTASFRLDTGKRRISAAELAATRQSVAEALQEKPPLLAFEQTGETHLAAGRVREALAEFQRLAAAAPGKALPRTRIARALLAGGLGEAAREEARRATQLEPKLAVAWRDLGWILQHDELGRRFGRGFDRAGAIAAYRKAKELDAKDGLARADLAILLEHDAQGRRYSPKGDLAAAIDEYTALRKDLANEAMTDNLLIALVRAGRFAEAKELAAKKKESATGILFSIVATAASEGAEAAVRESERRYADDSSRATAQQQAAQNLVLLRRYPEAAALLERAGRQAGNAAAMLAAADLVRRAKPFEDLTFPADQPATPVRRLMLMASAPDKLNAAKVASLFSRDLSPDVLRLDGAGARSFEAGLAPARRALKTQEVPPEVAVDLALGGLRDSVSGSDETGFRVRFTLPMDDKFSFEAYVVREAAEYRIAGVSTSLPMLGAEAFRRIDRNDLPGARQWLDWASELSGSDESEAGDPIPGNPFRTLWTRGSGAGAEDARCAAAALLTDETAAKALPVLESCRSAAGTDSRRNAFEVALIRAYERTGRLEEREKLARRLWEGAPGSAHAEALYVDALLSLDRWPESRAVAERRLQRAPDDLWALRLLANDAQHANDLDKAEAHLRRLVGTGKADANDFNSLAWLLLERGRVDDQAVEYGQRAASLSQYGAPSYLHTLASIYAEMGKTAEAYQVILQSLAAKTDDEPAEHDWYVFGRLAEQYGLPDVARKYYQKVSAPKDPAEEPLSTHALAVCRLGALGEEKTAKRAKI